MKRALALLALVVVMEPAPALPQHAANVACGVIPVRPRVAAATAARDIGARYRPFPSLVGRVIGTNGTLITLSLGPQQRLTRGEVVSIFRHGPARSLEEEIGSAHVEEVFERHATMRVAWMTSRTSGVRPGDSVRARAEGKIPLPVIALVDAANDPAAGAAVRELLDALTATRRFAVSAADAMTTTLRQDGLSADEILNGRGFADAVTRFDVDHVLVVSARSVDGAASVDARIFWLSAMLRVRLFSLRPACDPITGEIETQARFDAHRRGCTGGDAHHCSGLGALYERPPFDRRPDRALALAAAFYRLACDGGDAAGCSALGRMYRGGLGVSKGPERAVRLSRQGCVLGDGDGCAQLAELYETGAGVTVDVRQARDLYRRACDLGAREVCGP